MELKITPNAIGKAQDTLIRTAAGQAAMRASQAASPTVIAAAQKVFQAVDIARSLLMPFEEAPNPLLGWLSPLQAAEIMKKVRGASPSQKNLFFMRLTDAHPPPGINGLQTNSDQPVGADGKPVSAVPWGLFDLLALDVSYSSSVAGEKAQIGSGVRDIVTGREAVEVQVTTIDDEVGSIKRWFEGKLNQIANLDGTFNPVSKYAFEIEIVHGIPHDHGTEPVRNSDKLAQFYSRRLRVRAASIQHELSRRDQGLAELQMTFTQLDTWNQPKGKA